MPFFLSERLQAVELLQPEQLVHVDDRGGLRAARHEVLGERVHHQVGLLEQREEVRVLHPEQLPAGRRGREHRIAVLLRERHHGEVRPGAPRRQDEIDLVAAHELLVGAHDGLGVAAVVQADQLDLALDALDVEAAGGVHLLGPHDVVRLLRDLRARGPGSGAGDGVADPHRVLGEDGGQGGRGNGGRGDTCQQRCELHGGLLSRRRRSPRRAGSGRAGCLRLLRTAPPPVAHATDRLCRRKRNRLQGAPPKAPRGSHGAAPRPG